MSDRSIKMQILDYLENLYATIVKGEGTDDYKYQYSLVTQNDLANQPKGKALVMVVHGGEEAKQPKGYPVTQVLMAVELEVHYMRELNKEPAKVLQQLQSEIERRLMEDETLGGLAINCNVVNTAYDVDGRFDNMSEAMVLVTVLFRHHRTDPRRAVNG